MKKLFKLLFACAIGIAVSFSTNAQETVYCIADLNVSPCPINSYGVSGNTLAFQAQQTVPYVGGGAVGITMDEANGVLFVCYEFSNVINMLDAVTMQTLGTTTAPGASNLSGLAFDPVNSKLYATDRNSNKFYSWSWTFAGYVLTNDFAAPGYVILPGLADCWDIALDHINGVLYCGDAWVPAVRYYNVGSWGILAGSYTIGTTAAIGVDIDIANQILYVSDGFNGSSLSKYVIGGAETIYTPAVGSEVLGVAINQTNGAYLYLTFYSGGTYGDNLAVMDVSNGTITWNSGDIGNPTAVLYTGQGYNPLGLTKTVAPTCFVPGHNLTYTLSYNNGNPSGVTGVIVTDTLPPNVTYVSNTCGGVFDGINAVTWTVGALPPGGGGACTVTVTVNSGIVVNNKATINSNETGLVLITQQTDPCTAVPLSDWAIYLLIVLIGGSIWFRYRRTRYA